MEKDTTKFKDFNLMVTIIREFDEPKVVGSVARKLKVNQRTVYRALAGLAEQGFKIGKTKLKDCHVVKHQVVSYSEAFNEIIMELARKIMWGKNPPKRANQLTHNQITN